MAGHGFNSEVAQNKSMAASFDHNQVNDNLKSPVVSSSQSTSDISLGKKVIILSISSQFVLFRVLDINIRR